MALCLALFTLAVTAGNRGFLSIGDWLKGYQRDLVDLFNPPKGRLPSYSTIRRVLLNLDYAEYSAALARFFGIEPLPAYIPQVDDCFFTVHCSSQSPKASQIEDPGK